MASQLPVYMHICKCINFLSNMNMHGYFTDIYPAFVSFAYNIKVNFRKSKNHIILDSKTFNFDRQKQHLVYIIWTNRVYMNLVIICRKLDLHSSRFTSFFIHMFKFVVPLWCANHILHAFFIFLCQVSLLSQFNQCDLCQ